MNVVIANSQHTNLMNNLDIDIIKSLNGVYSAYEIVDMFKSFFYSNIILDVTALKDNNNADSYSTVVRGLGADKIIFLLPAGSSLCTPSFLCKLIDMGIYNFTTNVGGVKYLISRPNTLKDVEHIKNLVVAQKEKQQKMAMQAQQQAMQQAQAEAIKKAQEEAVRQAQAAMMQQMSANNRQVQSNNRVNVGNIVPNSNTSPIIAAAHAHESVSRPIIIGVKNVTEHAGATTFTFMLKRELCNVFGRENIVAFEIGKSDFKFFNDRSMISVKEAEIGSAINKFISMSIIIVDLNNCSNDSFCSEIIYLIEPSTIMLSKLVKQNKNIFPKLANKKVVLNKSLLLNNDVFDFENEAGIKIFYNMPCLDERKRNAIVNDFLTKLGVFRNNKSNSSGKIFGLFRR